MSPDLLITLIVLVGAVALFVSEKWPVDVVALLVLGSLLVFGVVRPNEALSSASAKPPSWRAVSPVASNGARSKSKTGAFMSTVTRPSSCRRNSRVLFIVATRSVRLSLRPCSFT